MSYYICRSVAEFNAHYGHPDWTDDMLTAELQRTWDTFACDGWMLLEGKLMDSSYYGTKVIYPFGPKNTFDSVPDHPVAVDGLASHTSVVVAVLYREFLTRDAGGTPHPTPEEA